MRECVYDEIKKRIVLLDYEPGQPLREQELATELGMSRTPIREALIRLESEGLVRIVRNSGVYVSEVRLQDLKNVFEIRCWLVQLVGRLAAERMTDEEFARIKAHTAQIKEETTPHRMMQLDSELHVMLNNATRNALLVRTLEMLRNQAVRIWTFSRDSSCETFATEFSALEDALEERDGDRCAEILRDHTQGFVDRIRSHL